MSDDTRNLYGNIRFDHFGRVVVDPCESDQAHLARTDPPPAGLDRHRCRQLVEDQFREYEGKKGMLSVRVRFYTEADLPKEGSCYIYHTGHTPEFLMVSRVEPDKAYFVDPGDVTIDKGWEFIDNILDERGNFSQYDPKDLLVKEPG